MSSPTSFDRLPQEICLEICSHVPDSLWRKICRSLSLTCKSWRDVAQPLLCQDIELDGPFQRDNAVKCLAQTAARRRELLACTRSIQMKDVVCIFEDADASISKLLDCTPRLDRLIIQLPENDPTILQTVLAREELHLDPPVTPLTELTISSASLGGDFHLELPHVVSAETFQIVGKLSSLERVTFIDPCLHQIVSENGGLHARLLSASPMASNVRHLHLVFCRASGFDRPRIHVAPMQYLGDFLRIFADLRSLHVDFAEWGGDTGRRKVGQALRKFTSSLVRLVLSLPEFFPCELLLVQDQPSDEAAYMKDRIGSLAEFERLTYIEVGVDEIWVPSESLTLASCLPKSIEELHLDANPSAMLEEIRSFHEDMDIEDEDTNIEETRDPYEYLSPALRKSQLWPAFCNVVDEKTQHFPSLKTLSCELPCLKPAFGEISDTEWQAMSGTCAKASVHCALYVRGRSVYRIHQAGPSVYAHIPHWMTAYYPPLYRQSGAAKADCEIEWDEWESCGGSGASREVD